MRPSRSRSRVRLAQQLTDAEVAACRLAIGEVDPSRIRVHRSGGGVLRRVVLFLSGGRPITLGRHIYMPSRRGHDTACLAHELLHVRQYEEWGALRYYLRGAREQGQHLLHRLKVAPNPYDWRRVPRRRFSAYGMEQQAQLVEDAMRGDGEAFEIVGKRVRG